MSCADCDRGEKGCRHYIRDRAGFCRYFLPKPTAQEDEGEKLCPILQQPERWSDRILDFAKTCSLKAALAEKDRDLQAEVKAMNKACRELANKDTEIIAWQSAYDAAYDEVAEKEDECQTKNDRIAILELSISTCQKHCKEVEKLNEIIRIKTRSLKESSKLVILAQRRVAEAELEIKRLRLWKK